MAPVGGEVLGSGLLSTASVSPDLGVFSLLLLIIISVYFTSLCSNCGRRSFDMREPEVLETPSALIKVAKLEECIVPSARENPMIHEMKNDELENGVPGLSSEDEGGPWFTPWRSHLGSQKDPEGDDDQAANPTPANQLLARLQASADSTQEWVHRKQQQTPGPPPASSAPALQEEE